MICENNILLAHGRFEKSYFYIHVHERNKLAFRMIKRFHMAMNLLTNTHVRIRSHKNMGAQKYIVTYFSKYNNSNQMMRLLVHVEQYITLIWFSLRLFFALFILILVSLVLSLIILWMILRKKMIFDMYVNNNNFLLEKNNISCDKYIVTLLDLWRN